MCDVHVAEVEEGFDEVLKSLKTFEFGNETGPNLELDALSLKLRSNPHYFVSWYEDRPTIKVDNGTKMIGGLLEYSVKPRTRREIEDYKLEELHSCLDLVIFFVEAFITMEMGQTGWSTWTTKCITGGVKLAENLIGQGLNLEYVPGIKYLHRWMSLHILVAKGKVAPSEAYDWVDEFGVLPSKSKGLLFAAKSVFLSTLRTLDANARDEGICSLREVVQLDSLRYEWHYHLGNWLRSSRRRSWFMCNGGDVQFGQVPKEEEIKILWETYDVCDYKKFDGDGRNTTLRNMALAGVCQGIADIIRFRARKGLQRRPFQFGGLDFQCEQEAVSFVRENVECMMTNDAGVTYEELLSCGAIISGIFPRQYRDYKAGEEYNKKAWCMNPTNSKINHRIGCLYLDSDELRNIPRSLRFLRQAVESEMYNMPAVFDLIKTLMSSPLDNMEEIQKLLAIYLRSSSTKATASAFVFPRLVWLDGCAKFMNGDNKIEAAKIWITAQRDNTSANIFLELPYTIRRYQWNSSLINYELVKSALTNALSDFTDENDSLVLQRLISTLPVSSNRRERSRPLMHLPAPPRPAQESDLDNNWRSRSSTSTSLVSDNGNRVGKYQPQYQARQFHDHNREYQNSYRNNNYPRNRTSSQPDRPSSPQSWRLRNT